MSRCHVDTPEEVGEKVSQLIFSDGLWATHNVSCAVCGKDTAILQSNYEVFLPCRKCQKRGFKMVELNTWFKRFLYKNFIKGYSL